MRPTIPLASLALGLALAASGCKTPVTQAAPSVSKALADDCVKHCGVLEMRLTAVVVVAGAGGCVCEPKNAPASEAPRAGAAAAGAGAFIVAAQEAVAAQQAAQSQPSLPTPVLVPPPAATPTH